MSFDDYAHHIYQKHRLAVALAIIKSKPANVQTNKYLEELKSKMDDDNATVCSDDFLMDDDEMNDSVTILKDFDPDFVINDETASEKATNVPENLSQITYYNSSQSQFTENIVEPLTADSMPSQDGQILDIEQPIPRNIRKDDKQRNIVGIDSKFTNTTLSKAIVISNNKPLAKTTIENMDTTYYDSQKTLMYTVHGYTQDCSHFSPSQNDIIVPNKYLYAINKSAKASAVQNKNIEKGFENESQFVSKGNRSNDKMVDNSTNNEEFQSMNMFPQISDDNFNEIHNIDAHLDIESNITMSNVDMIVNRDTETQNLTQYSQNVEENYTRNSIPIEITDMVKNGRNPEITNTSTAKEPFENSQYIDSQSQNIDIGNTKTTVEVAKGISNEQPIHKIPYRETNTENPTTQNSEKDNELAKEMSENSSAKHRKEEYKITEEEYQESEEVISYKVLEEFNKVKSFLSRQKRRMSCDGYSTDSGYRSDSQRSNNRSALQLSGNWLNQSGCCLFNYIMQCPLVADTRDITNEIAQVLSQLIDRLHEEEKYPSFLEDILETTDSLLLQVYEGESGEDNEFLRKDENIQRILLLNKSIHIQKHSIEKMSNILEKFHTKATEIDSTYELLNINQVENITYIFHLLEIILKKYLKCREIFSQKSTQNSQDDEKVLKKSSISDIWRKKWNPTQKVFEGSREKKCVLKNCSEILNRIVVDCVSSYSLVAFSALKCFNSMQT